MNYRFTKHLRERYVERSNPKFLHLENCRQSACPTCLNLAYEIDAMVRNEWRQIDSQITEDLQKTKEDRSFINNTEFMSRYYQRYGYDERFTFLKGEKLVFVVIEKPDCSLIATCIPAKRHIAGQKRMKFRKEKTTC